jgi:hypothetical protein
VRTSPAFRPKQIGPDFPAGVAWSLLSGIMIIATHTASKGKGKTAPVTAAKAAFIEHQAMATTRHRQVSIADLGDGDKCRSWGVLTLAIAGT